MTETSALSSRISCSNCSMAVCACNWRNDNKKVNTENAIIKINRRTELSMALSYKNLGDLTLLLSLKNGFVSVQIAAAQAETKKSLEENLSELESALKNAKINIEDIKILEVKNDNHSNRPG